MAILSARSRIKGDAMGHGSTVAAVFTCLAAAACTQQIPAPTAPVAQAVLAPAPASPSPPVSASIRAYTDMLMFDASIRGDELRLVMRPSVNQHHATGVDYDVYQMHVEGLCMCIIGKMKCDWSGEPIHRISLLDVDGNHGYSFSGGETECRSLGTLNSDESAAFIRGRTTRE